MSVYADREGLDVGTNSANELYFDPCVLQSLAILGSNRDSSPDRFPVHVQWCLFPSILLQLHVHHRFFIAILQDDVDIDRSGEEVGHGGELECKLQEIVLVCRSDYMR